MGGLYREQGLEVIRNWIIPIVQPHVEAAYQNLRDDYLPGAILLRVSSASSASPPPSSASSEGAEPALPSRPARNPDTHRNPRPRSMYHNKDRGEWVGALKIILRSISLEATNGDDDPVRETEEAEIQVSDDLLHRGDIKRFMTPCGSPSRFSRCADGQVRIGASRPASGRSIEKRLTRGVAFHTATLSMPSVLVSCRSSAGNREGEPSEEMRTGRAVQRDERLCTIRFDSVGC